MRNEVAHRRGGMVQWVRSLWPSYREVTVAGARARYLCAGSGPPLLLLASPLALARSYGPVMRALGRSFTVVCVELPGSGGSERLTTPWTTQRYAEWTLELVRYLPLAAPIVVAHAGASPVAVELGQLAPAEIGGLVLVDAAGTAESFGVRAVPEIVWNALRHRGTIAQHMKNACTSALPAALGASTVPTLHAPHLGFDARPLTASIRRFVGAVRRGAYGAPLRSAGALGDARGLAV